MSKNYDAILYDLDGTLINSVPIIVESYIKTYEDVLGECVRTVEDFKSYIGKPLAECFTMHDEETSKKLFDRYLEINCEMLEKDMVDLFPGVMEGLTYLKNAGYKQGIMTSKKESSAMITLKLKGMDSLFDTFVFSEDTPKHKPCAEPLILAANKLGIKDMSRVLYVGDAIPDAACAFNAGADFALVSWTQMTEDRILEKYPGKVISSLKEIESL